jgi:hypothetical protein
MPDMSAISAISSSLNSVINLSKAFVDVRDATLIQGKVFELQRAIIDAQQHVFAANEERSTLIERVTDLEKELTNFKNWETEKKRYTLTALPNNGGLAYLLKPEMENGEPSHYICAFCYNESKKSILQTQIRNPGMARVLARHGCGAAHYTQGVWHADHAKIRIGR